MSAWGADKKKMKEMKEEGNEKKGSGWGVRDGHALLSIQSGVFRG